MSCYTFIRPGLHLLPQESGSVLRIPIRIDRSVLVLANNLENNS